MLTDDFIKNLTTRYDKNLDSYIIVLHDPRDNCIYLNYMEVLCKCLKISIDYFNNTLINRFNGELLINSIKSNYIIFKNEEDIQNALEWINSFQIMKELSRNLL